MYKTTKQNLSKVYSNIKQVCNTCCQRAPHIAFNPRLVIVKVGKKRKSIGTLFITGTYCGTSC